MQHSWATRERLNRNEQWKLEKDGLAIIDEIDDLATGGFDAISESDKERLKWAGIYQQQPKDGHFLVRVKLPSGELDADRAEAIAGISRDYGADSIQITIRQSIQVHNLSLESLPDVLRRLHAAGLTSTEGCGDVPRNVLGNPLMGIDPDETIDTTPIVHDVIDALVGDPAFSNLPRKYKVSISANPADCGFSRINDIAFVPAVRTVGDTEEQGFHVVVGGGLSAQPKMAKKLSLFLRPSEVVLVTKAFCVIFRECGYRENRGHCRLKYLVEDWGTPKVEEAIARVAHRLDAGARPEDIMGEDGIFDGGERYPFLRGGRELQTTWNRGVFHGVHEQKQEGLLYVGVNVPEGAMGATDLQEFANLARRYGSGRLRTTNSQNILIIDVPRERVDALLAEPLFMRFALAPGAFTGYCAACTGNQYCSWAPIETKHALQSIVEGLDQRFPGLKTPVRVNLTGCVHACAHPMIADIGMTGCLVKTGGRQVDGVTFMVGGNLGKDERFGTRLAGRVPLGQAEDVIAQMVQRWLEGRRGDETFWKYVQRVGTDGLQEIVSARAA